MRTVLSAVVVGLVAVAASGTHSAALIAQEQRVHDDITTPLDRSLGAVSMEISCGAPAKAPFLRLGPAPLVCMAGCPQRVPGRRHG